MTKAEKLSGYLWAVHIPNSTQTLGYRGQGNTNFIASNQRVNGMAANRRVEVIVYMPHSTSHYIPPKTSLSVK